MKKSNVALLLLISIISSLFSCKNLPISITKKTTNVDLTYYSITTAKAYHENNYYMEIDVKIPKITYSSSENDVLFDNINSEIENKLTSLIADAKENALLTYKTYLNTAKNNIKNDREIRIENLKQKYKNILGSEEVKSINDVLNMDKSTDSIIKGFTNSDNLIIPELHNKNIIVIETTSSKEVNQTTVSISGNPGNNEVVPEEKSFFNNTRQIASRSDFKRSSNLGNPKFREREEKLTTNSNLVKEKESKINNYLNASISISTKSNLLSTISEVNKILTLDDFYEELNEIKMIHIPNDNVLLKEYTPSKITCNFDVKCLDEDYISLFIELCETKTVTNIKKYFYNIDLKNKKIIKLSDVLGDNYKEICVNSIKAAIENFDEEQKSKLKSDYNIDNLINSDTNFFINNNHIPVVAIDKFAITPGYVDFQIFK